MRIPLLLALALIGCDPDGAREPSTTSATSTAPAPPTASSARPRPQGPAIRVDESLSDPSDGVVVATRLFVHRLSSADPIRLAFQLTPADEAKWSALEKEKLDWTEVLAGLRVEITAPGGKKHILQLAIPDPKPQPTSIAYLSNTLTIDGGGMTVDPGKQRLAWREPIADLFAEPGRYAVALTGEIKTASHTVKLGSKPLEVEMVAPSDSFKSLAELESAAAAEAARIGGLKTPPAPARPTVEDVEGNRWVEFHLRDAKGAGGYDIQVIDVVLTPAGKTVLVDEFSHFTCIARGTAIATENGEVPVEELRLGDRVVGMDVVTGERSVSTVVAIERAHAEGLYAIGRLRVTGNHPIFAGGRWIAAAELEPGATLLSLDAGSVPVVPLRVPDAAEVFDISVTAPHTYFAGGWLVHNKVAHVPLGGKQPWRGQFYRRAAGVTPAPGAAPAPP